MLNEKGNNMIEKLGFDGLSIFDVELSKDNRHLILTEACDMYFSAELSKDQVIELANDFLKIAETMSESTING